MPSPRRAAVLVVLTWSVCQSAALAQTSKAAAAVQSLDNRATRTVEDFSKEAFTIAQEYEQAGQFEKAKSLLQTILVVRPELKGLKEKIKQLDEAALGRNEFEVDFNPTDTWKGPVARVGKGQTFRVQTGGDYRVSLNLTVPADGVPTANPLQTDMADAPFGALLAVVLPFDKKKAEDARPFVVGNGKDHTPSYDGVLFLKVNVPRGSKCTGELKVTLSGAVAKP